MPSATTIMATKETILLSNFVQVHVLTIKVVIVLGI